VLAAFLTPILFSASAVFGQQAARWLGGATANFGRLLCGALVLAFYAHSVGAGFRGTAFPLFFLSGCIGFGLGDAALFQALPRLGSRLTVMMVTCLSSPLGALLEWLWLGTDLSRAQVACGLSILAGVALALIPAGPDRTDGSGFAVGLFAGFAAAVFGAWGAVLSRKAFAAARLAGENIDGISAAYQRVVGGLIVTTCIFATVWGRRAWARRAGGDNSQDGDEASRWRSAWGWVVMNGLAGPALGVSCYQWALKSLPAGIVLPIAATSPLAIIPFARYIEGERPTWRSLLGGAIAVTGAVALALV
jgi:drug/metabolite transporter (DMT)-like permease